jgi:hypothetical protein
LLLLLSQPTQHVSTQPRLTPPDLLLHLHHQMHQLLDGEKNGTALDQPVDGSMETMA